MENGAESFFEDETKKKQKANGRIQTYKLLIRLDQTRPTTAPSDCSCKIG
jgi:hypothetical protein